VGTNATLARRWFQEVWLADGEKTVEELLHPDGTAWLEGRVAKGPADFKDARGQLLAAFPDLVATIDGIVEQDENVVVRWSATATHLGPGLGMPATKRPVSIRGMTWMEFRNGQIVRGWDSWNLGGLIASLAAPEAPGVG